MIEKVLAQLAPILTPPRTFGNRTVEELNELGFVGRVQLSDWRLEMVTVPTILFLVLTYVVGNWFNKGLVTGALDAVNRLLTEQFAQVGVAKLLLYVRDDAENYTAYATGRVNVALVKLQFRLQPRQNVVLWLIELVMLFFVEAVPTPQDTVRVVIEPSAEAGVPALVWAVASKRGLNNHRTMHYLLLLTRTLELPKLPPQFVFMTEAAEFLDVLYTPELARVLPKTTGFLKFIAVADQLQTRPETVAELELLPRVVVDMTIPTLKADRAAFLELLLAALGLVDLMALPEGKFRPEALKKVDKTRQVEMGKILKAREEEREEQEKERKLEEKRKLRDQLRSQLRDLQKKAEEKERKKEEKKMRKSQMKRVKA